MSKEVEEIKKYVGTERLIVGFNEVMKKLRSNELEKIFIASNPKEELLKDMEYYSKLANVPIIKLDIPNSELGPVCKKRFYVSFLGISKSKE